MRSNQPLSNSTEPVLRFTPTAWAKLLCLRDAADAEVGGFGLSDPSDHLLVTDILLVKQEVSSVTVAFDDAAVADLFEEMALQGWHPEQFGRIWVHTHPGSSPQPSGTDEETFERVFGSCHWAVMLIIARGGQSYARIRFGVGPGGEMEIPVRVDYSMEFEGSDRSAWLKEHLEKVRVVERLPLRLGPTLLGDLEGWEREIMLENLADPFGL